MKSKLRLWGLGILILFVASCDRQQSEHTGAAKPWPELRVGYLPIAAELPLFVALEQGFFTQAGITVKPVKMPSSNEMATSGIADQIDILAGAAINAVIDAGIVSGKKHLLFLINPYSNSPGHVTDHLLVRSGLDAAKPADLRGKKIAGLPGSVRALIFLVLEKNGLSRDSYQYIEMLPKDWEPSLRAGAVDAVVALEPSATQIVKDGAARSIMPGFYAQLMDDLPISGHWIGADYFARADKAQLSAFISAYKKAIDFCRTNDSEARASLVKYANVREDIVKDVNLTPWQPANSATLPHLQAYVDLLAEQSVIQKRIDFATHLLPPNSAAN